MSKNSNTCAHDYAVVNGLIWLIFMLEENLINLLRVFYIVLKQIKIYSDASCYDNKDIRSVFSSKVATFITKSEWERKKKEDNRYL